MRYVAAYLLAALGGNASPSEADLKKILSSVGIDAEADNLKRVISQLKGKDLPELIAAGKEKLAAVPSGGGAVASSGAAAPAAAAEEEKKEEAKKEESDEGSDDDMGFGLFD